MREVRVAPYLHVRLVPEAWAIPKVSAPLVPAGLGPNGTGAGGGQRGVLLPMG